MTEATKKKHVAQELNDYYHLPDDDQFIVQVIRGCGNNLHEVITSDGEQYLVSMPTKFRRSVWIKRGDYLIVTPIEEGNKVRAEIHSILMKDHIRYLKEQNKWPQEFDDSRINKPEAEKSNSNAGKDVDSDESSDQEDDLLVPNMNRINFSDDPDDDEEEEEEEFEED